MDKLPKRDLIHKFEHFGAMILEERAKQLDDEINRLMNIKVDNVERRRMYKDLYKIKSIKKELEFDAKILRNIEKRDYP